MAGATESSQRAARSQGLRFAVLQGPEQAGKLFPHCCENKNRPCKSSAGLPVPLEHKLPGSSPSIPTVEPYVLCLGSR